MQHTFHVIGIFHGAHDHYTTTATNSIDAITFAIMHHDAADDNTIIACIRGGDALPIPTMHIN